MSDKYIQDSILHRKDCTFHNNWLYLEDFKASVCQKSEFGWGNAVSSGEESHNFALNCCIKRKSLELKSSGRNMAQDPSKNSRKKPPPASRRKEIRLKKVFFYLPIFSFPARMAECLLGDFPFPDRMEWARQEG
jgi:hypothetical protein